MNKIFMLVKKQKSIIIAINKHNKEIKLKNILNRIKLKKRKN